MLDILLGRIGTHKLLLLLWLTVHIGGDEWLRRLRELRELWLSGFVNAHLIHTHIIEFLGVAHWSCVLVLGVEVGLGGLLVVDSCLSDGLQPILLLVVEHFVALNVAEVAHVAHISECIVVIEASLASPVANSLLVLILSSSVLGLTLPGL